ncbi:lamin tail domain-containing protein [Luteolibacter yonseiensis]|uniref:Lamin tail domain-containing protein n=1 Tax=Luteolibacter yonseiensis TaxID=1144680 RepID=A0A934R0L8_9BACT|nr:lamin tail domain-containing protein [Luteolibacter yonseiensis]MBK1816198.1 lamin tail domain-containing protein [Luteolibacter yonseiensis]
MKSPSLTLMVFAATAAASSAQVRITEYSYKGLFGQYFEISNLALTPVNLNNWRFNNNTGLYNFGAPLPNVTLGTNGTVIVTEVSATVFDIAWYAEPGLSVPVNLMAYVENNTKNFEDVDEIRLFNPGGIAVDVVSVITSIRDTEDRAAVLNAARTNWVFADTIPGSWKAGAPGANGPVGNPGVVVP